jgi:hypothetical protein
MTDAYVPPPPPPPPPSYLPPDDSAAPPPPPPPPAGPRGPRPKELDFVRCFTFVFEDPRWVAKVLVGGLFVLASFVLVGIFFLAGYMARLARNVVAEEPYPLPEWEELADYFVEGLKLCLVAFVYMVPILALTGMLVMPMVFAGMNGNSDAAQVVMALFASVWWGISVVLGLLVSFWLGVALTFAAVRRSAAAAFEFSTIAAFIRANLINVLLAFLIVFVMRFIAGFGVLLCCVGVIFTMFWAACVTSYAYAQTYKISTVK